MRHLTLRTRSRPVDRRTEGCTPILMERNLPLALEGKLAAAASRRGVSVEALACEALERAVDYDDWFICGVETGLAQVDVGQTLTHDAVGERMAKKLADHDARR